MAPRPNPQGASDGSIGMKDLLGGKGAGLCEMASIGVNVPPGFTVATTVCKLFRDAGGAVPDDVWAEIIDGISAMESALADAEPVGPPPRFGSHQSLLLVSVRSGAAVSMPGMMETVLDLGLTEASLPALARRGGSMRFAHDTRRRFLDMYGSVVLGVPHAAFEAKLECRKRAAGATTDAELSESDLRALCDDYLTVLAEHGVSIPDDPFEQLRAAVGAVFRSWDGANARKYREVQGLSGLVGTAVNVQCMVYGNAEGTSGSGVAFSRDPATGAPGLFGEYLANAQGEDVVSGARTPSPVAALAVDPVLGSVYVELVDQVERLEARIESPSLSIVEFRHTSHHPYHTPQPYRRDISAICKTWSLRWRVGAFSCSSVAAENGPAWRRCGWHGTSIVRASSTATMLCCWSSRATWGNYCTRRLSIPRESRCGRLLADWGRRRGPLWGGPSFLPGGPRTPRRGEAPWPTSRRSCAGSRRQPTTSAACTRQRAY